MKLSIIIPTLNEEKYIERTLKNLKQIHSTEYEIVVADTASKDNTRKIAKQYADTVVVYDDSKKPNAGIIRNLGASASKGDILLFQDADVILKDSDSFVARACDFLKQNENVVAITASTRVEPELETLTDHIMYLIINMTFVFLNNIFHIGGASGECQIIRRTAFEKVGGYNESLPVAEDNEIFQKLARIGRTRILTDLLTLQPGRRPHSVGWPRLLWQWQVNWFMMTFRHKSASSEWEEVR